MSRTSARRVSGRDAQRKKAKSNQMLIIAAIAGAVAVILGAWLALSGGSGSAPGEQQFANQVPPPADSHIGQPTDSHPAYNSNPPTSGWHTGGNIAPWGVTTQP